MPCVGYFTFVLIDVTPAGAVDYPHNVLVVYERLSIIIRGTVQVVVRRLDTEAPAGAASE